MTIKTGASTEMATTAYINMICHWRASLKYDPMLTGIAYIWPDANRRLFKYDSLQTSVAHIYIWPAADGHHSKMTRCWRALLIYDLMLQASFQIWPTADGRKSYTDLPLMSICTIHFVVRLLWKFQSQNIVKNSYIGYYWCYLDGVFLKSENA